MESHYVCPFRYRLVLCIKKFTKKALTLTTQKSPLGVKLSLSHTHIGLLWGFNLNLPKSTPVTFIWESPPPSINPLNPNIYIRKINLLTGLHRFLEQFVEGIYKKIKALALITYSLHLIWYC